MSSAACEEVHMGCDPRSYVVEIEDITPNTIDQLRNINTTVLPMRFSEAYYSKVARPGNLSKFAYFNDVCVGSVVAEIETDTGKSDNASSTVCSNAVDSPKRIYISSLAVLGPYRNLGIGAKLLDVVINFCRDLPGAESVYLHVKSLNENAINFYKKSGFKEREHVRGYYTIENAKYDAIVLEKRMKSDEPGVEKPS